MINRQFPPQKDHPDSALLSESESSSTGATHDAELDQALRQINDLSNEMDSLLHFLSHDLRAPLRGIDGYSQALIEDYREILDPMGRAYLEYIRDSSRRLSDIIDGLLKLYRAGRAELSFVPVDLSEIAASIGREFELKYPLRSITQKVTPGITVIADHEQMHQLLNILYSNAFKFTSKHHTANLEFNFIEDAGKRICYLRDDGAGFDMTYKDKLFLPFQRLHGQQEFEGLGLGLAIAQKIILRHNGRIWAEGEQEKGTTIYFSI
jgi:light-regulated signal transduction histidine kinase (bacteriophytochrome)